MNTDPQNQTDIPLDPEAELSPPNVPAAPNSDQGVLASPTSDPSDSPPGEPASAFAYRGNGKVARLPKSIRDQINNWMLDGLSYPDIIQRLGAHGTDLTPHHLSQWRKRGHQDWLLQQSWLEQTRARQEPATELSSDFDATQLNHAALQLSALQIFEALRDLAASPAPTGRDDSNEIPTRHDVVPISSSSPPAPPQSKIKIQNSKIHNRHSRLDLKLGGDSAAFVRLINALARASRETMQLQKYREACAKARAALHELKDPKRKLTDSERRAIVRNVDQILGLGSDDDEAPAEQTSLDGEVPMAAINDTSLNGDLQQLIPQSSIVNIANCQS